MGTLWPIVFILFIAVYAAAVAEASGAAWAYCLLLASPLAALGLDLWCGRSKLSHVQGVLQRGNRIFAESRVKPCEGEPTSSGYRPESRVRRASRILRPAAVEVARPNSAVHKVRNGADFGRPAGILTSTAENACARNGLVAGVSRGGRGRIVRRSPFELN